MRTASNVGRASITNQDVIRPSNVLCYLPVNLLSIKLNRLKFRSYELQSYSLKRSPGKRFQETHKLSCLPREYFGLVCAELRALDSEADTVVDNLLSGVETSDDVDLALNAECPIILTTLTGFGIGVCGKYIRIVCPVVDVCRSNVQ